MFSFGGVSFALAKDWLVSLAAALRSIRTARQGEMDDIANIFGDPEELARNYIQPDCQQFNPADSFASESEHIVRQPIFDRLQAFIAGDAVRSTKHLFVLSDAGMGKTSALVMLKLAHLTSFWPPDYKCLLYKLDSETLAKVSKVDDRRRTVLLLDALDEDALAWTNRESRLTAVLSATQAFRRVIITCRTQFFASKEDPFLNRGRVQVSGHICPVIFNSPLSDDQVAAYLCKRFPDQIGNADWRERVSTIVTSMGQLSMRPMLLTHIEDLLNTTSDKWDEFSIYTTLITAWLLREQRKMYASASQYPDIDEIRFACRHVAVAMLRKGRPFLTADEFQLHAHVHFGISRLAIMNLGVRSLLTRDTAGNYRFSHFSFLEFLAVESALLDPWPDDGVPPMQFTPLMVRFAQCWIRMGNFQSAEFRRLKRVSISGLDLAGLSISNADLSSVRWPSVNLAGARITDSSFEGAHLPGANLDGVQMSECNLRSAMLSGSSCKEAVFNKITGQLARFRASCFAKGSILESDFQHGDFEESDFSEARIVRSNFDKAEMRRVEAPSLAVTGGTMAESLFSGTNLQSAVFDEVSLRKTSFAYANLSHATFKQCGAGSAVFSESNLVGSSFTHVDLTRADFRGLKGRAARLSFCDLSLSSFARVDAEQMMFASCSFAGANLCGAYLTKTTFEACTLDGVQHDDRTRWPATVDARALVPYDRALGVGGREP